MFGLKTFCPLLGGYPVVICSITRFRNQVSSCNYLGTWIQLQFLCKWGKTTLQWCVHTQ